ncbi:phage holin family protein [Streptomyces sp. NPDC091376]|uniref:phage holin family protein n=1 Tax=Streptomyces sp. NPDC091376 TaxID=3365994 RepID=UPI003809CEB7
MDTNLSEQVAQVVRDAIADELRAQTRKQRRTAAFYTASGAVGLYAGAAVAACLVLLLHAVMPAWVAALLVGVVLAGVAYVLKSAATKRSSPTAAIPPEAPPLPPRAPDIGH